jgi:hypothetical protein
MTPQIILYPIAHGILHVENAIFEIPFRNCESGVAMRYMHEARSVLLRGCSRTLNEEVDARWKLPDWEAPPSVRRA